MHKTRRSPLKAWWFILFLGLSILSVSAISTWMSVRSARINSAQGIERHLEIRARDNMAGFMGWYNKRFDQAEHFAKADIFRLFATEISNPTLDPHAPENDELSASTASIQTLMLDFVRYTNLLSARLITPDMQIALDTLPVKTGRAQKDSKIALTEAQIQTIRQVFESGTAQVAPVRSTPEGPIIDVMQPVLAPDYITDTTNKTVAVLVLSCNLADKVQEFHRASEGETGEMLRLAQAKGDILQTLKPDGTLSELPGWKLEGGHLPVQLRELPDGSAVYSTGLPVAGLPLIMVQAIKAHTVQEELAARIKKNLIVSATVTFASLVVAGMFWWWLVGRRERSVGRELRTLYDTVNRQNQLLASIDDSLPGGVVLTDAKGIIQHANRTFGAMRGHSAQTLIGLSLSFLFHGQARETLDKALKQVLDQGIHTRFVFELDIQDGGQNGTVHYKADCAPFKDEDDKISGVVSVFQDITEEQEKQKSDQQRMKQTMTVLTRAIEAVDPYLRGQSDLTGELSGEIATLMDLPEADIHTVVSAAHMFQIGLIQVPRAILNKEEALTREERTELELHVQYTREALSGMDFGLPVLEAICQMHERMDGSGYPDKLHANEIGIHGRILAVANTFCALLRPRSYRHAKNINMALEILSQIPHRYDPELVAALRTFLDSPKGRDFMKRLCSGETSTCQI